MYTNRLKGLMSENGHTQSFLADYLNISCYGFAKKLNGQNEFKASEIKKIADLYNVSIDYFFSDKVARITTK
ncbi:helix-turn-helix domain-containing protein [Intestinibacter bartlettii]|uniref:helix-turn-helix domain-containing protein n=1 Tax=Intestinibacter bartlettii TaxID=261299 RepID=UPI0039F60DF8